VIRAALFHLRPKTVIGHVADRCNAASPNRSIASVVPDRSLSSRTLVRKSQFAFVIPGAPNFK